MTRTMLGMAATIAVLAGGPAVAQSPETASARISIAGMDLSSSEQQVVLQKRIRHTAWILCNPRDQFGTQAIAQEARRCVKNAVAEAQAQVDRSVALAYARKAGTETLALASHR
jgi:UrcA family protein